MSTAKLVGSQARIRRFRYVTNGRGVRLTAQEDGNDKPT